MGHVGGGELRVGWSWILFLIASLSPPPLPSPSLSMAWGGREGVEGWGARDG